MLLRYTRSDGQPATFVLDGGSITVGRSHDADLVLDDDRASRMHCAIRHESGRCVVKDLQSKNGTYVNGRSVEECDLSPGDRLRVGATILSLEEKVAGPNTAIQEVEEKMAEGKGYGTILKEIVKDVKPGRG